MECLVDAGVIVVVNGTTERDCASLAVVALGERVRYPITVHVPATGDWTVFTDELQQESPPPKKPPKGVRFVGGRQGA